MQVGTAMHPLALSTFVHSSSLDLLKQATNPTTKITRESVLKSFGEFLDVINCIIIFINATHRTVGHPVHQRDTCDLDVHWSQLSTDAAPTCLELTVTPHGTFRELQPTD